MKMTIDIGTRLKVKGENHTGEVTHIFKGKSGGRDPRNWRYSVKVDTPDKEMRDEGCDTIDCCEDELLVLGGKMFSIQASMEMDNGSTV
jgi:hypothetical protein